MHMSVCEYTCVCNGLSKRAHEYIRLGRDDVINWVTVQPPKNTCYQAAGCTNPLPPPT